MLCLSTLDRRFALIGEEIIHKHTGCEPRTSETDTARWVPSEPLVVATDRVTIAMDCPMQAGQRGANVFRVRPWPRQCVRSIFTYRLRKCAVLLLAAVTAVDVPGTARAIKYQLVCLSSGR